MKTKIIHMWDCGTPDKEKPGATKPVWYVYQAFATDKEDEVFNQYKNMIGIENWNEIRYKGKIVSKKVNDKVN